MLLGVRRGGLLQQPSDGDSAAAAPDGVNLLRGTELLRAVTQIRWVKANSDVARRVSTTPITRH